MNSFWGEQLMSKMKGPSGTSGAMIETIINSYFLSVVPGAVNSEEFNRHEEKTGGFDKRTFSASS